MPMFRHVWRATRWPAGAIAVVLVAVGISGYFLLTRAPQDTLRPVDAIVVLGGEHDGREQYALTLARQGLSKTVVMSNPYGSGSPAMRDFCASPQDGIEVICRVPNPGTTRGEALLARDLATERGWDSIIVLTWQYHLPRTRFIFDQCYSSRPGAVLYTAVPRRYDYSVLRWE
ncbi:MAG: YdcF family protein [Mycobacterium sp.]